MADEADATFAQAMPALEAASKACGNLSKGAITEVKSFANPPVGVIKVMSAVLTLLGKPGADWAMIRKEIADPKFMDRIVCFDKNNISKKTMV